MATFDKDGEYICSDYEYNLWCKYLDTTKSEKPLTLKAWLALHTIGII
jgi:hypothetical protein